jgi:adenine-specific DNA-methyltransferase
VQGLKRNKQRFRLHKSVAQIISCSLWKDKWTIKSLIKTLDDVKPVEAPAGTGVYGGLYILTEHPEGLKALETQDFMNYVKMLGKYKSGGYYTFSSKELENYLNWSYGKKKD